MSRMVDFFFTQIFLDFNAITIREATKTQSFRWIGRASLVMLSGRNWTVRCWTRVSRCSVWQRKYHQTTSDKHWQDMSWGSYDSDRSHPSFSNGKKGEAVRLTIFISRHPNKDYWLTMRTCDLCLRRALLTRSSIDEIGRLWFSNWISKFISCIQFNCSSRKTGSDNLLLLLVAFEDSISM